MILGPTVDDNVRRVPVIPITAVRSSGFTTAAMNAERGAWSMLLRPVRMKKRMTVNGRPRGMGKRSTAADEGRCVKTMVFIRPRCRARGPANTVEQELRR